MHNSTIPRVAARLSLGLSVAFLALLTMLHVLEPEFNSGHLISEYQLGDYGFLMSLAFCLLGASALTARPLAWASPEHARRTRWLVGVTRYRRGFSYRGRLSSSSDARHHRLPARHIRTCSHFRLADYVHLDQQKSRPQRSDVSVGRRRLPWGNGCGLGRSLVLLVALRRRAGCFRNIDVDCRASLNGGGDKCELLADNEPRCHVRVGPLLHNFN